MTVSDATAARIRSLKKNGHSVNGIAQRLKLSRLTVSNVLRGDLTPLNVRTTRKYLQCQENGGCVPSRKIVRRPFPQGDVELPVCRNCKVPIRGKGSATRWSLSENTSLFAGKKARRDEVAA